MYSKAGFQTLKSMANRKSPGTDGFTVEFLNFFWNDIGKLILKSLNEAYDDGELSIVQRQGIITCIPKENCDRSILKNWRPITLLNVIYKIASGSIANRLKKVIPSLISEEQRGFIKGRYIGENIRLIYDVMQVITEEKMKGLLLIVDFEKAFDSISRKFIGKCLQYFGFGSSIISWIKTLIMSAGACVVQNGHKSHFFPVRRGTRQGDPLSGYIYLLCAEILNILVHCNDEIKGIQINGREYTMCQFADDTEFFLDGTERSLRATLKTLELFKILSGQKMNINKTKAVWLGSMANSPLKLCSDVKLNWTMESFKILGILFTNNLEDMQIINYQKVLKELKGMLRVWRRRHLSLHGRISVVKSLGISKLTYFLMNIPRPPDNVMKDIQKEFFRFIWADKKDKIKRSVLTQSYEKGGLKMVDVFVYDQAVKLTWIDKVVRIPQLSVYGERGIDINTLMQTGGVIRKTSIDTIKNLFWRQVWESWNIFINKHYMSIMPSDNLDQPLWNNPLFEDKTYFLSTWFRKGIKCIRDILLSDGKFRDFDSIRNLYGVQGHFLEYGKLINIIPLEWKNQFRQGNITPSLNDYVSPVETFLMQGKTNTTKRYYERLIQNLAKPVSQVRWEENLGVTPLSWESFYVIPLQCTREVRLREFQYKLIHRIIGVKDHLFKMRIVNENSCSFCKKNAETIEHLFVECDYSQDFWKQFTTYLKEKIQKQIILTKLDILFGVSKGDSMINHMIILGKKHMFYRKRNNLLPSLEDFVSYLKM